MNKKIKAALVRLQEQNKDVLKIRYEDMLDMQ